MKTKKLNADISSILGSKSNSLKNILRQQHKIQKGAKQEEITQL